MRPTRLAVFAGEPGSMEDYWIEDGLPLAGIDLDEHDEDSPHVEIMLGDASAPDSRHMTHIVTGVRRVKLELGAGGNDGLDLEDANGEVTLLRFEPSRPQV